MVVGAAVTVNSAVRNSRRKSNGGVNESPRPASSSGGGSRASWRDRKVEEEREGNQRLLASDPRLQDAQTSTAVQMLKACEFKALTIGDIEHLLKILGGTSEYMEFEQLRILLTVVLDPPLTSEEVGAVWNLSEKRPDGNVSAEEIFKSMQSGHICHALADLHQSRHKHHEHKEQAPLVDRELFKYWVGWRSNRDDAFRTLPVAVTYLLVFVLLVMCHLQIAERKIQERALETWVTGWSMDWGGPYLHDHVTSVGYFHYWLEASGMTCIFSDARTNEAGEPFIHMASSSLLVGDAKLVRTVRHNNGDIGEEEAWLLNSLTARLEVERHQGESSAYEVAAKARLKELNDGGFFDYETEEMRLEWVTYNHRTRMFCLNLIRVVFKESGYIVPSMGATAVIIEPYPRHQMIRCGFIWALCGLYCLLILIPMWDEGKEMLLSMKVGLKGFIKYWGFWNGVDWATVIMGISVVVIWLLICMNYMRADSIQMMINKNDFKLHPDVMTLKPFQIQQMQDDLANVVLLFYILQIIMAANTCTILLKLFKAFQSNARLNVVTDTMVVATTDIIHFMIVFMVIFVGYSMMAHVLFGNDLKDFESFGTSMMTSFNVLMGDFGWYVDFQNSPTGLGSGMPRAVMTIWYITYQIVVLLCLLNMLLAVILERYAQVSGALEGSAEAPTLWVQVGRYFERRKATKGFIPLVSIVTQLEMSGSKTVHPENGVTTDSIMQAFPGMKPEQAKWLMKYLEKEAKARQPEGSFEDVGERLNDIQVFVESIAEELHIVQITALLASRKVDALEEQAAAQSDAHPAELSSKVDSMIDNFGKQVQEQARATDELRVMMQELANTTQRLHMRATSSMPEEKLKDGMGRAPGPRMLPPCCATDTYSGGAGPVYATAPRSVLNQNRPIAPSYS